MCASACENGECIVTHVCECERVAKDVRVHVRVLLRVSVRVRVLFCVEAVCEHVCVCVGCWGANVSAKANIHIRLQVRELTPSGRFSGT